MRIEIAVVDVMRKKTNLYLSGCNSLGKPKPSAHTRSTNAANPISAIASN